MGTVGYYLFYAFNWVVTLLPLRILYIFSDIIFPFMYYFPGYRRNVVRTNLKNSFPDKSEKEIKLIEKKFYHHLCDLFMETFKLTHMSNEQLMQRIPLLNPELLDRLYNEGRDVVAVLGHFGNWEWMVSLPLFTKLHIVSIYKPLRNKHFDNFMINSRSKTGMVLTPMQHIIREVINNRKNNVRSLYAFIADQAPPKGDIKFWTRFLNQDTPVYLGAEKVASKYDMAVIFFKVEKAGRGHYNFTAELLFEHSAGLPDHLITETHVKILEELIIANPEFWIWSHRRWKHKREDIDG
jgi:KDO2-lipid IV(A) lauroyltransferase